MSKAKTAGAVLERMIGYSVVAFFALDPGVDNRLDKLERKADLNTAAVMLNHPEIDREDKRSRIVRTLDAIWIFN